MSDIYDNYVMEVKRVDSGKNRPLNNEENQIIVIRYYNKLHLIIDTCP